ncbi:hypothetical protein OFS02_14400 [Brachyspira hyodysenteriae]|uniref:hypothetical protein n=1 Tax=Brachyspira hyodysenteriae TaxID=159 RepID=UPI0022CE2499|nr:hypothetical protein [Brachyspira hyodysenteriae]MDA0093437.1 hypothetical protein [Brachyspira hyodysenteriae]
MQLSNEELEEIVLLESELASICGYSETAKHILQGRKFNKSRELENKITQGRRLSELTIDELKELNKVTMNDHYRESPKTKKSICISPPIPYPFPSYFFFFRYTRRN